MLEKEWATVGKLSVYDNGSYTVVKPTQAHLFLDPGQLSAIEKQMYRFRTKGHVWSQEQRRLRSVEVTEHGIYVEDESMTTFKVSLLWPMTLAYKGKYAGGRRMLPKNWECV